jgi:uncharacterized coiled-coil protein SlyX
MNSEQQIEIETKLAHVEKLVEELNSVVTTQQSTIHRLEAAIRVLVNKSADSREKPTPTNQPPPHY